MPVHWFALLGILLLQWNRDFFALADASSATATVDASGNVHIESTHVAEPSTENILPRVQTPFSDFPDYWQEYTYDDIRCNVRNLSWCILYVLYVIQYLFGI